VDHRLAHSNTPLEEIEVAPEDRLRDVPNEQLAVTAQPFGCDGREVSAAAPLRKAGRRRWSRSRLGGGPLP
jgi:hypothetical protein